MRLPPAARRAFRAGWRVHGLGGLRRLSSGLGRLDHGRSRVGRRNRGSHGLAPWRRHRSGLHATGWRHRGFTRRRGGLGRLLHGWRHTRSPASWRPRWHARRHLHLRSSDSRRLRRSNLWHDGQRRRRRERRCVRQRRATFWSRRSSSRLRRKFGFGQLERSDRAGEFLRGAPTRRSGARRRLGSRRLIRSRRRHVGIRFLRRVRLLGGSGIGRPFVARWRPIGIGAVEDARKDSHYPFRGLLR